MSIKLVTDSSCDLPEELVKELNIDVVPLAVTFDNDETFLERVEITPEEFWERMAQSKGLPKTSRPTPEHFTRVFQGALAHYKSVVYMGISAALSGTFESASLAQKNVTGDIHLIDSLTGSVGLGVLVIKAGEFVKSDPNVQSVVKKIVDYRDGMNTLFTMDSLENLIKGGRLSRLPGLIGTVLDIKPIGKNSSRGSIDILEKVRGRKKSLQRVVQLMGEMSTNLQEKIVGIGHLSCLNDALKLKESIEEKYSPRQVIITKTGSTMGTYAGPGGLIISF
ncbi:MAG: DegV family protein [Desulfocucumaceae bacterium]